MKRIIRISALAALVCGLAYVVSSCEQKEEFEEPEQEVVFAAATTYNNLPETRTIYSGDLVEVNGVNMERIDWVAGTDKIKVLNSNTGSAAVYTVGTPSTSGVKSEAPVTPDGAKLTWGSEATNTFYGVYPSTAMDASNVIGASIPAVQPQTESHTGANSGGTFTNPTMSQYAYMVAKVTANNGENVTLPFTPAMTAFEFKVGLAGTTGTATVKKFEMTSSAKALTGDWTWDGATETFTCPSRVPGTNDKITVNFSPAATSTASAPLRFTIFARPQDLSGVTITFTLSDDTARSLTLPNTFLGTKKYRITTPGLPADDDWIYAVDEINDIAFTGHDPVDPIGYNVKSYRYRASDISNKVAVPWKTQYSLDGGTTWTDVPSTGVISGSDYSVNSAAITGDGVGTSNYSDGEDRSAKLSNSTTPTGDEEHTPATIIADLASRTAKGSASSPYDLSMYDIMGNSHAQTTANSYVVTAPGTYKFPVVYGNAITNGDTDYTEAFWPASRGGSGEGSASQISSVYFNHESTNTFRYIARFIRADGQFMTVANIVDDMNPTNPNAAIVWQNRMELTPGETPGPIVQESSVSYDNGYITFTVLPEDIRPGNIVIALRGGTDLLPANTILWSWQIWVTADDLTPVTVPGGALMPYNLGYIDSTPAGVQTYPNRLIQFRIVQVENDVEHETEDFTIEQIGDGRSWDASIGFNVYYQWGRKDPMIPAKDYGATTRTLPLAAQQQVPASDPKTREVYPDADITVGTGYTINVQGIALAGGATAHVSYPNGNYDYVSGITHPYNAYINGKSTGWIGGYINGNIDGNTTNNDALDRQLSAIPVNLWNNGMYTTMDGNVAGIWKTVYDPCPPGFCVPTLGVFGGLTASSLVGRTSDGAYFNVNGARLFMPYSGLRVYYAMGDGNYELWAEEVRKSGWYWTDSNNGDVSLTGQCYWARCFSFGQNMINPSLPLSSSKEYTRGSALAIRPMVDPKVSTGPAPTPTPSPSPSPSAAPVGSIQPIGNGSEIPAN